MRILSNRLLQTTIRTLPKDFFLNANNDPQSGSYYTAKPVTYYETLGAVN